MYDGPKMHNLIDGAKACSETSGLTDGHDEYIGESFASLEDGRGDLLLRSKVGTADTCALECTRERFCREPLAVRLMLTSRPIKANLEARAGELTAPVVVRQPSRLGRPTRQGLSSVDTMARLSLTGPGSQKGNGQPSAVEIAVMSITHVAGGSGVPRESVGSERRGGVTAHGLWLAPHVRQGRTAPWLASRVSSIAPLPISRGSGQTRAVIPLALFQKQMGTLGFCWLTDRLHQVEEPLTETVHRMRNQRSTWQIWLWGGECWLISRQHSRMIGFLTPPLLIKEN